MSPAAPSGSASKYKKNIRRQADVFFRLSKNLRFFRQKDCSRLRGIFSLAQVARENDLKFLPPAGGKPCEAFYRYSMGVC